MGERDERVAEVLFRWRTGVVDVKTANEWWQEVCRLGAQAVLDALGDDPAQAKVARVEALVRMWRCNCGGPGPEGQHREDCASYYGDWLRAALAGDQAEDPA